MRTLLLTLLVAACISASWAAARAADIVIDDPKWLELTETERTALEERLKSAGGLEANDKIIYKGPKNKTISQSNTGALTAAPAVGGAICAARHYFNMGACSRKKKDERQACRDAEKSRYGNIKSACK